MKIFKTILIALVFFTVSSCKGTNTDFQKDADTIRLQHLKYYSSLLKEYFQKTGKYPFQNEFSVPLYVHIAHDQQIEFTKSGPPYAHKVKSFKDFVFELENKLGREINEYYDPQYRPDHKPNFYIYMITKNTYFFAIHVHQNYPFSKKVADYYYKIEISNNPNLQNKAQLPSQLFARKDFQTAIVHPITKPGFFKERENKYLHYTKTL